MQVGQLSIFFPFYNEEQLVPTTIKTAFEEVSKLNFEQFEVVAVENGSTDHTLSELRKLEPQYPQLRVIHLDQAGYGGAIKRGLEEAGYEWVFFADSDLQIDLSNLPSFLEKANPETAPLVIGYRTNRADGFFRWVNQQIIRLANRVLFGVKVKDVDCAFKLIHRSVLDKILPLKSDGAIISTEFLAKATRAKVPILELPVEHLPDQGGGSTGARLDVLVRAGRELIRLWEGMRVKGLKNSVSRSQNAGESKRGKRNSGSRIENKIIRQNLY